jgi:hypothetical protein
VLAPNAAQAFALYGDRSRPLRKSSRDRTGRSSLPLQIPSPDFRSVAIRNRSWNEREAGEGCDGCLDERLFWNKMKDENR